MKIKRKVIKDECKESTDNCPAIPLSLHSNKNKATVMFQDQVARNETIKDDKLCVIQEKEAEDPKEIDRKEIDTKEVLQTIQESYTNEEFLPIIPTRPSKVRKTLVSNELPKLTITKDKLKLDEKSKLKAITGMNSAELPFDPNSPNNNKRPNIKQMLIPQLKTTEVENKMLKDEVARLK